MTSAVTSVAAVALARFRGISLPTKKRLISEVGSVSSLLEGELPTGIGEESAEIIRKIRPSIDWKEGESIVRAVAKIGCWIRCLGERDYPRWLSQIADPPVALMGCGEIPSEELVWLGLVGPRRPSTYGARIARMLATDLAAEGVVLVSGLARGIDAIAHEVALKAEVPTMAVLGCGLDRTYPPEHAHLRARISKGGAVVSEYFPGDPPRKEHFPQRNRIISGLSRAVLLIEGGEKSGALITVRHAAEQSRDVFAVPGPIDAPLSWGPNRLISQGAKLVSSSEDILEEWPDRKRLKNNVRSAADLTLSDLSGEARSLLVHFDMDTPRAVEDIVRLSGATVPHVLRTLVELEMKGRITRRADARYLRVSR